MTDLTPLPPRLRSATRTGSGFCGRPNCPRASVITLNWDGLVLGLCAQHADHRAADPGAKVDWLAHGYGVCDRCGRVLPLAMLDAEHFTSAGQACRPMTDRTFEVVRGWLDRHVARIPDYGGQFGTRDEWLNWAAQNFLTDPEIRQHLVPVVSPTS